METNNLLAIVDGSYWLLYCIFGAFSAFQKSGSPEAAKYSDIDSIDQDNLPNILTSNDFRKELHNYVAKRIDTVNWILKENFQKEMDLADKIDILFVLDDSVDKSFRKKLYPAYKSQRKLVKKAYDVQKVKNYVTDILFKEFRLEEENNWRLIRVDGAEGDDIAAIAVKDLEGYSWKVLIASDRDFLQLGGIRQFDMTGKEILPIIKDTEEKVSNADYLLHKILMGDKSDFIPSCFERYGEKRCWKLVKDRETLRTMLNENESAAKRFLLNRSLIDMNAIPSELKDKILVEVRNSLSTTKKIVRSSDFSSDALVVGESSEDPFDI